MISREFVFEQIEIGALITSVPIFLISTKETKKMLTELYSFNWYKYNKDHILLRMICDAICIADRANIVRLRRSFSPLVLAHAMDNWDKAPDFGNIVPLRKFDYEMRPNSVVKAVIAPKEGSFNWYLIHSGSSFVKAMTKVVMNVKSLENMKKSYPQMVAAFNMKDWDKPPVEFITDQYNSDPL